jgi:hypothetical protein
MEAPCYKLATHPWEQLDLQFNVGSDHNGGAWYASHRKAYAFLEVTEGFLVRKNPHWNRPGSNPRPSTK